MKRNFLIAIAGIFCVGLLASCGTNKDPVSISITAESGANTLEVRKTLALKAEVTPKSASQEVNWSSSNEAFATVTEKGVVTGLKQGNVKIYATSKAKDSIKGEYALKIVPSTEVVIPTSIELKITKEEIKVGESAQISANVLPEGASQEVTYSSADEDIAAVSISGIVKGLKAGETTIRVASKEVASVYKDLAIKVIEDSSTTKDWKNMEYNTHEEYIAAKNDEALKVKGKAMYVCEVLKDSVAYLNYYLINGTSGYFIYQQKASLVVEEGKAYTIGGFKKNYNNTQELVNVEYVELLSEDINVTSTDITSLNFADVTTMDVYQGGIAILSQVKFESYTADKNGNLTINVSKDEKSIQLRVEKANFKETDFTAFTTKISLITSGTLIDVKGVVSKFGYGKAKVQLQIMELDGIALPDISDNDKVEAAKNGVVLQNSINSDETKLNLPNTLSSYEDLSITWKSDKPTVLGDDGVVKTRSERDELVKLTATFKLNEATTSKDYYVNVFGSNVNYIESHILDLEDAEPAGKYNTSATKSSYAVGDVTLGTPNATWTLDNALIGGDSSDKHDGTFSIRMQSYAAGSDSVSNLEIKNDFEFDAIQFDLGGYGSGNEGAHMKVYYSSDSGATYTALDREITVVKTELETVRFDLPLSGTNCRVKIVLESIATTKKVNVDNIKLLKIGA